MLRRATCLLLSGGVALSACRIEPPADPEGAKQRTEAERSARAARSEEASAKQAIEAHKALHAEVVARLQQLEQTEVSRVAVYQAAQKAHRQYHDAIAEAQELAVQCQKKRQATERAIEVHAYLAGFASEPARDEVIVALEACRKLLVKRVRSNQDLQSSWAAAVAGPVDPPEKPRPPPPAGGPEIRQLGEQAASVQAQLDTEVAREAAANERSRRAAALVAQLDAREAARRDQWQRDTATAGRRMQGAGIGTGFAGVALVALGGYFGYARSQTAAAIDEEEALQAMGMMAAPSELEETLTRQTAGMAVGLALGVPLLVTSVALLVAGKRRKDAARGLSLAPGGLQLRF